MKDIKTAVFWPPIICLVLGLVANLVDPDFFLKVLTSINAWILAHFGPAFIAVVLLSFVVSILVMFLPWGRVRLGGRDAKPLLSLWQWIAISICTNTAVGVLFWASAEPLFHVKSPPKSLHLVVGSPEAGRFALGTLYMHWSFLPCALYALPAAMFAFAFYNMRTDFSLAAALTPILGRFARSEASKAAIDGICLYALVAGMAASLATGTLTLAGGLEHLWGLTSSKGLWLLVTCVIVLSFTLSAATGLKKGVSFLSSINLWIFLLLGGFVLLYGPTTDLMQKGLSAFGDFLSHFVTRASGFAFDADDPWPKDWTIFYWAVWLAWAPVTAGFLGRIGYGYTVRAFMLVNLFIPAGFAIVWMTIFGGFTLNLELEQHANLTQLLTSKGPESVIYAVLATLPWHEIVIPIFLFTVFISYVSGADANTSAMAAMCSRTISHQKTEPPFAMKLIWATVIGGTSLVMLFSAGLEGIKMISNLGGVPALLYQIGVLLSCLTVAWIPERFDAFAPKLAHPHDKELLEPLTRDPSPAAGDI